jgi:hypothetical protein
MIADLFQISILAALVAIWVKLNALKDRGPYSALDERKTLRDLILNLENEIDQRRQAIKSWDQLADPVDTEGSARMQASRRAALAACEEQLDLLYVIVNRSSP